MEKSLINATAEERYEMSVKLHTKLAELLAHQNGMHNPKIEIQKKGVWKVGYLGFVLLLLGAGGMDDLANRPIATAYILLGLALVGIEYLIKKRKANAPNRPK